MKSGVRPMVTNQALYTIMHCAERDHITSQHKRPQSTFYLLTLEHTLSINVYVTKMHAGIYYFSFFFLL